MYEYVEGMTCEYGCTRRPAVPNPLGLGCQAADSYLTWVLDSELPASSAHS